MTPEQINAIGENVMGVIIVLAICVGGLMFLWHLLKD